MAKRMDRYLPQALRDGKGGGERGGSGSSGQDDEDGGTKDTKTQVARLDFRRDTAFRRRDTPELQATSELTWRVIGAHQAWQTMANAMAH